MRGMLKTETRAELRRYTGKGKIHSVMMDFKVIGMQRDVLIICLELKLIRY
jgi:hypothetical protein